MRLLVVHSRNVTPKSMVKNPVAKEMILPRLPNSYNNIKTNKCIKHITMIKLRNCLEKLRNIHVIN